MMQIWLVLFICRCGKPRAEPLPSVGYRVQLNGRMRANQRAALEQYARTKGIAVDEWVMEIGGGLNFERKQFLRLVDAIVAGEVQRVLIAHQDRLARFGFGLLKHLCETHQTDLEVMNTETLSPEQELMQDLMSIVHGFSSRLYGLRNYRKALEKALRDENRAQDQDESHP